MEVTSVRMYGRGFGLREDGNETRDRKSILEAYKYTCWSRVLSQVGACRLKEKILQVHEEVIGDAMPRASFPSTIGKCKETDYYINRSRATPVGAFSKAQAAVMYV